MRTFSGKYGSVVLDLCAGFFRSKSVWGALGSAVDFIRTSRARTLTYHFLGIEFVRLFSFFTLRTHPS